MICKPLLLVHWSNYFVELQNSVGLMTTDSEMLLKSWWTSSTRWRDVLILDLRNYTCFMMALFMLCKLFLVHSICIYVFSRISLTVCDFKFSYQMNASAYIYRGGAHISYQNIYNFIVHFLPPLYIHLLSIEGISSPLTLETRVECFPSKIDAIHVNFPLWSSLKAERRWCKIIKINKPSNINDD